MYTYSSTSTKQMLIIPPPASYFGLMIYVFFEWLVLRIPRMKYLHFLFIMNTPILWFKKGVFFPLHPPWFQGVILGMASQVGPSKWMFTLSHPQGAMIFQLQKTPFIARSPRFPNRDFPVRNQRTTEDLSCLCQVTRRDLQRMKVHGDL